MKALQIGAEDFFKSAGQGVDQAEIQKALEAAVQNVARVLERKLDTRQHEIDQLRREAQRLAAKLKTLASSAGEDVAVQVSVRHQEPFRVSTAPTAARRPADLDEDLDDVEVDAGGDESAPRKVLRALAQHGELDARKLAILAGIKRAGSTYRGAVAKGRNEGLIEKSRLALTAAGQEAMRGATPLPRGKALRAYWSKRLGDGAAGRVYRQLISHWPNPWDAEALAAAASTGETPLQVGGSTWRGALAKLRGLDLTAPNRALKASDELFDE